MYGPSFRDKGPSWWDAANIARALENDFGVGLVFELGASCPVGHTELGLMIKVAVLKLDEAGTPVRLKEFGAYRSAADARSVPAILYGLMVKQVGDWLEDQRKEDDKRWRAEFDRG